MKWAVIEDDDEVHVVPSNDDGEPLAPHFLLLNCCCHPDYELYNKTLVLHNDII
jgi:hypothetical protein